MSNDDKLLEHLYLSSINESPTPIREVNKIKDLLTRFVDIKAYDEDCNIFIDGERLRNIVSNWDYYYKYRKDLLKTLKIFKSFYLINKKDIEFIDSIIALMQPVIINSDFIDAQEILEKYNVNCSIYRVMDLNITINTMQYINKTYKNVRIYTDLDENNLKYFVVVSYIFEDKNYTYIVYSETASLPVFTSFDAMRIFYVAYVLLYKQEDFYKSMLEKAQSYFEEVDMLKAMEGL